MKALAELLSQNALCIIHCNDNDNGNDKEALHRTASEESQLSPLAPLTGKHKMCHTDPSIANPANMLYRQYVRVTESKYAEQTLLTWW